MTHGDVFSRLRIVTVDVERNKMTNVDEAAPLLAGQQRSYVPEQARAQAEEVEHAIGDNGLEKPAVSMATVVRIFIFENIVQRGFKLTMRCTSRSHLWPSVSSSLPWT